MAFAAMLEWVDDVTSTMDLVAARASDGAPEGLAIAARRQARGRGRRGDAWWSPEGGLWLSLLLRPAMPAGDAGLLGIACGVAAAEAIAALTGLRVGLKWPNDLLVGGRKLGGILVEATTNAGAVTCAIVGFGINVNVEAGALSGTLAATATSTLIQSGRSLPLEQAAEVLLGETERRYGQLIAGERDAVIRSWRALDETCDRRVRIDEREGVAVGVGADGALLVKTPAGLRSLSSGDVEWL